LYHPPICATILYRYEESHERIQPRHFRAQFPALADAGVYLDSAATTLKPLAVIEASDQFYRLSAGNVHRSQFAAARS
jgi:cysteine sulfinate desulfinase